MDRLYRAHLKVDFRYKLIDDCYQVLMKIDPGNAEKYASDCDTQYQLFMKADREAFKVMNNVNTAIKKNEAQERREDEKVKPTQEKKILYAAKDLRPDVLDESFTPLWFENYAQKIFVIILIPFTPLL